MDRISVKIYTVLDQGYQECLTETSLSASIKKHAWIATERVIRNDIGDASMLLDHP